jgi:hypothetical protein
MRNNSSSSHEMSDLARRKEFLASRKAAGRVIDVETCKIGKLAVNVADPYGVYRGEVDACIGNLLFVASLASDGWVLAYDLPEDKRRALDARIDRANQTPTTPQGVSDILIEEYNRAVTALDDVIYDLVEVVDVGGRFPGVPFDVIRSGTRLALAKLGKQGTPLQEALERKFCWLEERCRGGE